MLAAEHAGNWLRTACPTRRDPPARPLARLAFAAALAVLVVVLLSGVLTSFTVLLAGFAGLAIACAAAWWFLAHRGIVRWLACAVLVAAPVAVIMVYVAAGLLWEIALGVVLAAAAVAAGRAALSGGRSPAKPREACSNATAAAFMIMNPRSGGGKVGKFGLKERPPRSAPRWLCSKVPEWWTWPPWHGRR